jgi:hypothetical protein
MVVGVTFLLASARHEFEQRHTIRSFDGWVIKPTIRPANPSVAL